MSKGKIDRNLVVMAIEDILEGPLDISKIKELIDVMAELPTGWKTPPFNQKLTGVQEYASFLDLLMTEFSDKLTDFKVKTAEEIDDILFFNGGSIKTLLQKIRVFKNMVIPYAGATTYYGTAYGTNYGAAQPTYGGAMPTYGGAPPTYAAPPIYGGAYGGVSTYWDQMNENVDDDVNIMYIYKKI